MSKEIFVLTETDPDDGQVLVIGVFDSLQNADKMMSDYYKGFEVKRVKNVKDRSIEWYKYIEFTDIYGYKYRYTCTLQSFTLNEV